MKLIKKLLCITIAVLLCFSLIGCNVIDEMRDAQIHFNDAGNLVYNNYEYRLLPECNAFTPDYTFNKNLYITDKDVPVLLSQQFSTRAYLSNDGLYIDSNLKNGGTATYARNDIYEKIANRINAGNYFEGYCYTYSYYDEDDEIPSYKTKYEFLSDEIKTAIDYVLSSEPVEDVDISLLYQFEVISLFACSKDYMFKEYATTIYKTESFIYLATNNISDKVYKVPREYMSVFENLINNYEMQLDSLKNYPMWE